MRNVMILALSLLPSLARAEPSPSLSCVFTEPFASIYVWPGKMLARHEGSTPVTNIAVSGTREEPVIKALVAGTPTTLTVKNQVGSDGMSEFDYPLDVTLTGWMMGSTPLSGGCIRFPAQSQPFSVTRLAEDDRLNLRAHPRMGSPIVGHANSRDILWSVPGQRTNGWARVAIRTNATTESGPIRIKTGWVRASYMRELAP